MVQPKTPPVSLRIPAATRDAVEQHAAARGISRNAAYVELIATGLDAAPGAAAKPKASKASKDAGPPPPAETPSSRFVRRDTYPDWMRKK